MKSLLGFLSAGICGLTLTLPAHAGSALDAVRTSIQQRNPGMPIEQLQESPVKGLYYAVLGNSSGYVTADGEYFIAGDLFDVGSRSNVTEQSRKSQRVATLAKLGTADAIVFAPAQPKYAVTIFTDVDCPYCRKLHAQIAQYNELGIAVRYVAYPRSGPGTESWATMEAVWCAKDRRDALARAKRGEKVDRPATCTQTPVADQYAAGRALGLQGTPMMVLEDGSAIGGYLEPEQLLAQLELHAGQKAAARR